MMHLTHLATLSVLAASVLAQSPTITRSPGSTARPSGPVVTVTFPGDVDDGQTLVGSLVGTASQLTTLAVGCPAGTDPDDCGFGGDVTLIAGSNTLALTLAYDQGTTVQQHCSFSTGGGVCTITALAEADESATGAPSTTTITTSFGSAEVTSIGVIITAGNTAGLAAPTSRPGGGSGPGSGASASTTSTTRNDAKILMPGSFGALLMGLAAVFL